MSAIYLSNSGNAQYQQPPMKSGGVKGGSPTTTTSSTSHEDRIESDNDDGDDDCCCIDDNKKSQGPATTSGGCDVGVSSGAAAGAAATTTTTTDNGCFTNSRPSPISLISPITPTTPMTPVTPIGSGTPIHYKEVSPEITPIHGEDINKFSDAIIIDIRSFNHFSTSHFKHSINLCIPSTLLKRKSYKIPQLFSCTGINAEQTNTVLTQDCKLLFIDNNSTNYLSSNLYVIITKFLNYNPKYSIHYLMNGFDNLPTNIKENQSLMESGGVGSESEPHINTNNALSGFKLPSCTPANQKFIASVKKNTLPKLDIRSIVNLKQPSLNLGAYNSVVRGGGGAAGASYGGAGPVNELDNYHYKFKIPSFSKEQLTKLPIWLKNLITEYNNDEINSNENILQTLNHKFTKLEKSEQVRLNLAINPATSTSTSRPSHNQSNSLEVVFDIQGGHSSVCSPNSPCPKCDNIEYKIPKGIEYGFKNRYNNIWPYEHSRVRLTDSPCTTPSSKSSPDQFNTGDDYFNANYINCPELSEFKYIATQNPLKSTIKDFWNIIYNNKIKLIICLNQQYQLTDNYFDTQSIGHYSIEVIEMKTYDTYKLRLINLTKHQDRFTIYHLEFTEWPDFGVPNIDSLLDFIEFKNQLVELHHLDNNALVHCSAGCGRTGCFIAIDLVINLLKCYNDSRLSHEKFNPYDNTDLVYKSIQFQRQQRISMCQNFDQYIVCYEAILKYLYRVV